MTISWDSYFSSQEKPILIDVRAPKEYLAGHAPKALSLPLLNDEERHLIGITYKQNGESAAVRLGFRLIGPQFETFIEKALSIAGDKKIALYCARGGKRSQISTFILKQAGLNVDLIPGGYKVFRRLVLSTFDRPLDLLILSGLTGSGKTPYLKQLKSEGKEIIDLEALACHKGSAFGSQGPQPTQEQFENDLALEILSLKKAPAYVEDESRLIGKLSLPGPFFEAMQKAPSIFLEKEKDKRLDSLVEEYGCLPIDFLIEGTVKLKKKLGGERTSQAIDHLSRREFREAFDLLLDYYDKAYLLSLRRRESRNHMQP